MNRKIKNIMIYFRNQTKLFSTLSKKKNKYNSIHASLIKNIHSIEKGLCIANPRLGFGEKKIHSIFEQVSILEKIDVPIYNETIEMAIWSLKEYYDFHEEKNYENELLREIKKFLDENKDKILDRKKGGTITISKKDMNFEIEKIEDFFQKRHSIRDYSNDKLDIEKLKKALSLAQKAPSACNRQDVRCYVIGEKYRNVMEDFMRGTGGFASNADKFILITSKQSYYNMEEYNQYIVSASMYAAYLTLTLHLYGFASCVVQRSLIWNKEWEKVKKILNIEDDEQSICILSVGNMKEKFQVPVSNRFNEDEIIKFL